MMLHTNLLCFSRVWNCGRTGVRLHCRAYVLHRTRDSNSGTSGLVAKSNVAIVGPRVRFPAGALFHQIYDAGGSFVLPVVSIPKKGNIVSMKLFHSTYSVKPVYDSQSKQHSVKMRPPMTPLRSKNNNKNNIFSPNRAMKKITLLS